MDMDKDAEGTRPGTVNWWEMEVRSLSSEYEAGFTPHFFFDIDPMWAMAEAVTVDPRSAMHHPLRHVFAFDAWTVSKNTLQ